MTISDFAPPLSPVELECHTLHVDARAGRLQILRRLATWCGRVGGSVLGGVAKVLPPALPFQYRLALHWYADAAVAAATPSGNRPRPPPLSSRGLLAPTALWAAYGLTPVAPRASPAFFAFFRRFSMTISNDAEIEEKSNHV